MDHHQSHHNQVRWTLSLLVGVMSSASLLWETSRLAAVVPPGTINPLYWVPVGSTTITDLDDHHNLTDRPVPVLCDECRDILRRASPVPLAWEPRPPSSLIPSPLWIRWPNGTLAVGYVPDETRLRRQSPTLSWNDTTRDEQCARRDDNHYILTHKIAVHDPTTLPAVNTLKSAASTTNAGLESRKLRSSTARGPLPTKILCLVYTMQADAPQAETIRETWGPKCDGFFFGSDRTDVDMDAYDIPHAGPEDYFNMWQKIRSMWAFVYDHYYDKYDWFHMGGNDMFLVVENLRAYLESDEILVASQGGWSFPPAHPTEQLPLHLGLRMAIGGNRQSQMYNCGGPGYTLNKAALKTLVLKGAALFEREQTYMEDVMVSRTLQTFGVFPYNTKDETGGERYMHHTPEWHYRYRQNSTSPEYSYYRSSSIDVKEGLDHFAAKSVALHRAKDNEMRRFFALLYDQCPPSSESS